MAPMIIGMAVLTGAPADTRPTMMLVEVELDWTSTVTSTPIIRPTMGFWSSSELEKRLPMLRPPRIRKLSLRNEREHTNKYRHVNRVRILKNTGTITCFTFSRNILEINEERVIE